MHKLGYGRPDESGAGAPEDEIEITLEMIEAGAPLLLAYDREHGTMMEGETVAMIYRAMVLAKIAFSICFSRAIVQDSMVASKSFMPSDPFFHPRSF